MWVAGQRVAVAILRVHGEAIAHVVVTSHTLLVLLELGVRVGEVGRRGLLLPLRQGALG